MEPIADKKKAIFESTLELVQANGFHGTPMSLVAKKAGVAAGTIYHYFGSKEELIRELFLYIQQQATAIVEREDRDDVTYQECFFNLWHSLYTFYSNNTSVLRFFEQFVNSPYNTDKAEFGKDEFHRLLFNFFERGIKKGNLRPVSAKVLGTLAHSNIISTVKIQASGRLTLQHGELDQIPLILWDGMRSR
jgi:AcrR family transcriptional regulator